MTKQREQLATLAEYMLVLQELDRVRASGITPEELSRAQAQLRARLVFDQDSVTNIAHQLGYFDVIGTWRVLDTLAERIEGVTIESVAAAAAARLITRHRTIGWFEPVGPSGRDAEAGR